MNRVNTSQQIRTHSGKHLGYNLTLLVPRHLDYFFGGVGLYSKKEMLKENISLARTEKRADLL